MIQSTKRVRKERIIYMLKLVTMYTKNVEKIIFINGTLNQQHLKITTSCCDIQDLLRHHLIFKRIAFFVRFQLLQEKNKIKLLRVSNLVFGKLIRKYWPRLAIEVTMIGH